MKLLSPDKRRADIICAQKKLIASEPRACRVIRQYRRGVAALFADEGSHVIINRRYQRSMDQACEKILAEYPKAMISGVAAIVSTLEGVELLYRKSLESEPIDILVNNTGIF